MFSAYSKSYFLSKLFLRTSSEKKHFIVFLLGGFYAWLVGINFKGNLNLSLSKTTEFHKLSVSCKVVRFRNIVYCKTDTLRLLLHSKFSMIVSIVDNRFYVEYKFLKASYARCTSAQSKYEFMRIVEHRKCQEQPTSVFAWKNSTLRSRARAKTSE